MASSIVSYQKVSVKYGIFVGLAHIVFFLLMAVLGLSHKVELSFLSGIFLIIGIWVAISSYKRASGGEMRYFHGLAIGFITGLVSSVILAVFLVVYLSAFESSYLANLQASSLFPQGLSILSVFALTIVYGSWPGFIIAFIAMQWFKRSDHTMPKNI